MPVTPTLKVEGYVGTVWRPIIEVHDEADALANAESITVTLRKPDDTEAPITAPKVGEGLYQPEVTIDQPGPWVLVPESKNPTAPGKLIFKAIKP